MREGGYGSTNKLNFGNLLFPPSLGFIIRNPFFLQPDLGTVFWAENELYYKGQFLLAITFYRYMCFGNHFTMGSTFLMLWWHNYLTGIMAKIEKRLWWPLSIWPSYVYQYGEILNSFKLFKISLFVKMNDQMETHAKILGIWGKMNLFPHFYFSVQT